MPRLRRTWRIARDEYAYWETRTHAWTVESGDHEIAAAASRRDIRLTALLTIEGDEVRVPLTAATGIAELVANPVTAAVFGRLLQRPGQQSDAAAEELGIDTLVGIPIGKPRSSGGGQVRRNRPSGVQRRGGCRWQTGFRSWPHDVDQAGARDRRLCRAQAPACASMAERVRPAGQGEGMAPLLPDHRACHRAAGGDDLIAPSARTARP
ncbi:hypothetical protein [Streptomyces sp. WG7]|uniref:hypothetical protein n=1 Tax=Streptomyces sp. WG7 TaxID=3417650 RepID=UPI003CF7702D